MFLNALKRKANQKGFSASSGVSISHKTMSRLGQQVSAAGWDKKCFPKTQPTQQ